MSKCPKCETTVSELNFKNLPITSGSTKINGTVFTCPSCGAILGAGVDPQTMVNTIIEGLAAKIRR